MPLPSVCTIRRCYSNLPQTQVDQRLHIEELMASDYKTVILWWRNDENPDGDRHFSLGECVACGADPRNRQLRSGDSEEPRKDAAIGQVHVHGRTAGSDRRTARNVDIGRPFFAQRGEVSRVNCALQGGEGH
jgi:hypothetical protein